MREVKLIGAVIILFAVIGVGLGLSGFLTVETIQQEYVSGTEQGSFARGIGQLLLGVIALQSLSVSFFIGSVRAAISGIFVGMRAADTTDAAVISGVGSLPECY